MSKKEELLARVGLFEGCSRKELKAIAALADEVRVGSGDVLTKEGKPGGDFFVIADGTAKVTLRGKTLDTLGPGSFFGEMALLEREPRSATVIAESPMRLYVLSSSAFMRFLDEAPSVAVSMLRGIARRLRAVEKAPTY